MSTMIEEKTEHVLNATDICDACSGRAYVWVKGVTGDLLFCAHHFNKIMDDPKGYNNMMSFMDEIIDERDQIEAESK